MRYFEFSRHRKYNLSDRRIRLLEDIVREQARRVIRDNVKKEHVQKLHQFLESKGESNRIQWFDGESEILSLGE